MTPRPVNFLQTFEIRRPNVPWTQQLPCVSSEKRSRENEECYFEKAVPARSVDETL